MTDETTQSEETNTSNVTSNEDLGVTKPEEPASEIQDDSSSSDAELVFGKYKDMEAAQEAFKGLESEIGKLKREKRPEAPEEYALSFDEREELAEFKDYLNPDELKENPYIKAISPAMQKHGITQEAFEDIVSEYLKVDAGSLNNAKEEFQSLGDDGGKILTEVQSWISKFPEEEQAQFAGFGIHPDGIMPGFTAANLKLAHKIMNMTGEKNIPDQAAETAKVSSDELKEKAYKLKRETANFEMNTAVQAQYEELMNKASAIDLKSGT